VIRNGEFIMRVIAAILMTFLLVGFIWAGAVQSKDQPLSKIVFYVS
jgi:hypothetical protein